MPSYAGVIGRARRRPANRRTSLVNKPQPTTPIKIVSAATAGVNVNVTFDQPVRLKGIPQYTVNDPATVTAAEMTGPTTLKLTFSGDLALASTLSVPYEEPAIRNASGGFVSTSTITMG